MGGPVRAFGMRVGEPPWPWVGGPGRAAFARAPVGAGALLGRETRARVRLGMAPRAAGAGAGAWSELTMMGSSFSSETRTQHEPDLVSCQAEATRVGAQRRERHDLPAQGGAGHTASLGLRGGVSHAQR